MGGTASKPDYTRKFEVLGAGYSRTGTLSLQIALEKLLDGPVVHGATGLLTRPESWIKNWVLLTRAKADGDRETSLKLLRENMAGYAGGTDVPIVCAVPELVELYPDVKVVLVTRDPEAWWRSFGNILDMSSAWYIPVLTAISPKLRWWTPFNVEWRRNASDLIRDAGGEPGVFGPQLIVAHEVMVRRAVPPEQLLVMQLSDGWEPLCKFLGKPVPDEPFPRVNDIAAAEKVASRVVMQLLGMWVAAFSIVGGSIYLTSRTYRFLS
ncbi:P-loop containing nucleoside triphosphate hydrolase protein [Pestalotiopsis sp. NC0098]|nr:P-loop containing nucleoside triphosphate hydrolase protein [Pestalotiopsis sp. NC0098]